MKLGKAYEVGSRLKKWLIFPFEDVIDSFMHRFRFHSEGVIDLFMHRFRFHSEHLTIIIII
jgi:hypothetical protein